MSKHSPGPRRVLPNPGTKSFVQAPRRRGPADRGFGARASLREIEGYKLERLFAIDSERKPDAGSTDPKPR
jgi:hypothetical protein